MKFLFISLSKDPHVLIVAAALKSLGHDIVLWDAPEESRAIRASIHFDEERLTWEVHGHRYACDYFDAIWLRRRRQVAPPNTVHEDDKKFAQGEVTAFFDDIWSVASPHTRWIHSPQVATAGENKLKQLSVARQIGFRIPLSLIGNDRAAILQFIDESDRSGEQVIYKTFLPASWTDGESVKLKHTTPVSRAQIQRNTLIEAVPGLYQRRIAKSHEVRSTFFGPRELSVAIDSQRHPNGKEDWRGVLNLQGYLSATQLPIDVHEKCQAMMSAMSLEMACFDFVVDEQGDYYFLELNQQGQFLWIEEQCPDVLMLDAFIAFIANEEGDVGRSHLSISDVVSWPLYKNIAEKFSNARFIDV